LDALWHFGPFPEPLFKADKRFLNLWQRERVERLVREDLRDISRIQELSQIEMLVSLLPERASGVLSINALREDLEVAYATMKSWIHYLKHVYYLFELKPYSQSIPRALKKEGKLYLWDWSEVTEEGARFENMIASHLLKYVHFLTDTGEASADLFYLKNKEKQEIDFLLVKNKKPWLPIEVKLSQDTPSANWIFYFKNLPCKRGLQIIKKSGVRRRVLIGEGEVFVISAEYILPLLV
jgi:predicted AAA+ superfamily ATPase